MAAAAVFLLGRLCLEPIWNSGVHSVFDGRMIIIVAISRVYWISLALVLALARPSSTFVDDSNYRGFLYASRNDALVGFGNDIIPEQVICWLQKPVVHQDLDRSEDFDTL